MPDPSRQTTAEFRNPQRLRSFGFRLVEAIAGLGALGVWGWFTLDHLGLARIALGVLFAMPAAPLVVLGVTRLVRAVWNPRIRLRRSGKLLLGFGKGTVLPINEGRIWCRAWMTSGKHAEQRYVIEHTARDRNTVLFENCIDPIETRAVAEAICKLGGYSMTWVSLGGSADVRDMSELDQPIASRAFFHPELLKPLPMPVEVGNHYVEIVEGVRIASRPMPARELAMLFGGSAAGGAVVAAGVYVTKPRVDVPFAELFLGIGGLFVGAALLYWLYQLLFPVEIVARREGITRTFKLLRLIPVSSFIPSASIESLLVENYARANWELQFVGDGVRLVAGRFASLEEALYARQRITLGLLGESSALPVVAHRSEQAGGADAPVAEAFSRRKP